MSRMIEGRIGPSDLSVPEVNEGQVELNEVDQNDASSLNSQIQEVNREQISIGDMPKKIWFKRHQNETSNIEIFKRKHSECTTHKDEKRFKYEISKEDFAVPSSTHIKNHTGKKSFPRSNSAQLWNPDGHMSIHLDEIVSCSECMVNFTWLDTPRAHMKKLYNCSECKMNFTRKDVLDIHMRIHTGEKPYNCSKCKMNFTRKDVLDIHMRIHTGEKPYNCSKCKMNFTQKNNLNTHMRIHTGVKPYNCSVCGKNFRQSAHMKRHIKIHDSNRSKFNCTACRKAFMTKSGLNRHMKSHVMDW
ncbi:zinc finger protein [Loa loa]|uniref:Zinc finger protein n=1 Tax=Loa loa TaxID=7209 RepID=A0A1I7VG48_LOALO|nr:zinc finger protein [Loa loa]EFO15904.2 zinc finger protein [Loa loa]